jgi:hypothetical protein
VEEQVDLDEVGMVWLRCTEIMMWGKRVNMQDEGTKNSNRHSGIRNAHIWSFRTGVGFMNRWVICVVFFPSKRSGDSGLLDCYAEL